MPDTPKTIWMLWLQGWDKAPAVAQASRASWLRFNEGWDLRALTRDDLPSLLNTDEIRTLDAVPYPPEALSDRIRILLLRRYGGVWADATTLCVQPLDTWLPPHIAHGFFAFDRPRGDRMISSWFLASTPDSVVATRWSEAVHRYWEDRSERDSYIWFHQLFGVCYKQHADFRAAWDATPRICAKHAFHFTSNDPPLLASAPANLSETLRLPPVPVFKLTHKFDGQRPGPGSLFEALLRFGRGDPV